MSTRVEGGREGRGKEKKKKKFSKIYIKFKGMQYILIQIIYVRKENQRV